MPYTISQAKDDLTGIVHGKTVSKITNINSAARRAAQNLLAKIDPEETRQIAQITIYDKVLDYAAPDGLKEKRIVDIRPQYTTFRDRNLSDNLGSRLSKDFDMRRRYGSWFTVMDSNGTKYLRIKAELTPSAATLDSLETVGSWTAGGAAGDLVSEDIIYQQGALQFDISAGSNPTAAYIQNTAITPVDLSDSANKSSAFFEIYIPSSAALAAVVSVALRWGNDLTANYMERTVTTAHLGSFKVGRNLVRIDWNGATKAGTVDATKIDSARITVNTNGTAISGMIASNLFFSIGQVWDIEYYSKYLFRTSSGTWGETVTDDTDLVNLDTASYNLFLYEFAIAALQQIQGKDALADRQAFYSELYGTAKQEGLYDLYKKNNPSQSEKPTQSYYANLGYRGSDGGRFRRW